MMRTTFPPTITSKVLFRLNNISLKGDLHNTVPVNYRLPAVIQLVKFSLAKREKGWDERRAMSHEQYLDNRVMDIDGWHW